MSARHEEPIARLPVDWLRANTHERARLYVAAKAALDLTGLTWSELYAKAFGGPAYMGNDYEANFRKGTIARKKAARIYAWLAAHHREIAERAAPDLFPPSALEEPSVDNALARWHDALRAHGLVSGISIVPLNVMGIVQRIAPERSMPVAMRLGEPFCFALTLDAPKSILILQMAGGAQHPVPIPMAPDGESLIVEGEAGRSQLPCSPEGAVQSLYEFEQAGLHQFVMLTWAKGAQEDIWAALQPGIPVAPRALLALAERLGSGMVAAHIARVIFNPA